MIFFFQAEDGIRDYKVTGVQTCALPILGVTGRETLRWLAHPHILQTTRAQFETLLLEIAEQAEEWLTSAQAMNLAGRPASSRVLPWQQAAPAPATANGHRKPGISVPARAVGRNPAREME